MADCRTGIPGAAISSLKETLCAQQKLLQKLYNELDAEREASASAANEALSVILRLQGEKAVVKMEAEQYKRLAEEKICHAEESFAIIEDIITQKEMEVAALDYQVQTLRYKLSTMGCGDLGGGERTYPENLLLMNQQFVGDTGIYNLARGNCAPVLNKYMKFMNENDNFPSLEEEMGQEIDDLPSDSDKKLDGSAEGGISSYVEDIKKLDIRVKEITGDNYMSSMEENQPESSNILNDTKSFSIGNPFNSNKVANSARKAVTFDDSCDLMKVHDVFEVPQVEKKCRNCESSPKCPKKTSFGARESLESPDLVVREYIKPYSKDEPDWLKKLLESTHDEKHLCKPSDIAAIDRALVHPATYDSEPQTSENQCDRNTAITELQEVANSTEELKVLKEIKERLDFLKDTTLSSQKAMRLEEMKLFIDIKEHLNLLQDEIRSFGIANKPSTRNKLPECPLQEAMLWFWL